MIGFLIGIIVGFIVFTILACMKVSGECSREEEKDG